MRRKDKKLGVSEKGRKVISKNYMKEITKKEDDWDHITEANMVEGPIQKVTIQIAIAIKATKPGKIDGPSQVCAEMAYVSGAALISLMIEFFQRVLAENDRR